MAAAAPALVASADPHAGLALLFMEGIQRQTPGCGSGTGMTTYTPEDVPSRKRHQRVIDGSM